MKLKSNFGISCYPGLAMLSISSRTLVWMIGGRIEVQLLLISPEFEFTINASKLQAWAKLHCFLHFHVWIFSIKLQEQESITRKCLNVNFLHAISSLYCPVIFKLPKNEKKILPCAYDSRMTGQTTFWVSQFGIVFR